MMLIDPASLLKNLLESSAPVSSASPLCCLYITGSELETAGSLQGSNARLGSHKLIGCEPSAIAVDCAE